jgi:hypothetical protein
VHAVWSSEAAKGNSILETTTEKRETFDHIIFACHSNNGLCILDAVCAVLILPSSLFLSPARKEKCGLTDGLAS